MNHRRAVVRLLVFAVVALAMSSSITRPTTTGVASQFASFQNTTAIEIPSTCTVCQQGPAKPYPSTIEVAGFKPGSVVSALVVRLKGLTHESPDDIDVLLAAPDSVSSVIFSDVGGTANAINKDIVLDFSFSGPLMPDDDPWDPGTVYSPTNRPLPGPADPFVLPAPQGPLHPSYLTYGRPANGTWSLYIMDDSNDAVAGSLGGGWQLDIWTNEPPIIAFPSDPPVFVEDGPPVALDPEATVVDVDTTDYSEGSLSVTWSNTSSADALRIRNEGTGPGLIGTADDRVLYSGTPFATFVAGAGALVVTFDNSTAPTVAAVQALLRSLVFEVNSENPSTLTRSMTITLASHDNVDGSAEATSTVEVRAIPDAPTISSLRTQTINEDTSTAALPFTVADADSPLAQLSVSARSSRPRLLPKSGIVLDGSGASRTIKLTPAPNANGKATVTISVSDGDVTSTSKFDVVVRSVIDPTQLSVRKAGNGGGTVTSVPAGIACGADCSETYEVNTRITLTASPRRHSFFRGWSEPCHGTGDCSVKLSAATTVRARFVRPNCLGLPATRVGSGTITGTPRDDVLVGTGGANTISGRGGNDQICSLGGSDRAFGGPGDDQIALGGKKDFADGGPGDDRLLGGSGDDRLVGGSGTDALSGGGGADGLKGAAGSRDRCDGGPGVDSLVAAHGCEVVTGVP